jgi:hypothetical protein
MSIAFQGGGQRNVESSVQVVGANRRSSGRFRGRLVRGSLSSPGRRRPAPPPSSSPRVARPSGSRAPGSAGGPVAARTERADLAELTRYHMSTPSRPLVQPPFARRGRAVLPQAAVGFVRQAHGCRSAAPRLRAPIRLGFVPCSRTSVVAMRWPSRAGRRPPERITTETGKALNKQFVALICVMDMTPLSRGSILK